MNSTFYNPATIDNVNAISSGDGASLSLPSSSTDNAVVRFDGTTGQTLQNSGVIVDDSNNMTGVGSITASSAVLTTAVLTTADINGGTIDGVACGVTVPITELHVNDISIQDDVISSDTGAISFDNENLTTTGKTTSNNGLFLSGATTSTISQGVQISHPTQPILTMDNAAGGVNAKIWQMMTQGDNLIFRTLNDGNSAASTAMTLTRSGNTSTGLTVGTVAINGSTVSTTSDTLRLEGLNWVRLYTGGSPAAYFRATSANQLLFYTANGTMSTINSNGTISVTSDQRLKTAPVLLDVGLNELKQLKPCRYEFLSSPGNGQIGFIAQQIENIPGLGDIVDGKKLEYMWEKNSDGTPKVDVSGNIIFMKDENGELIPRYRGVDDRALIALLVKSVQELSNKITTIEARLLVAGL